MVEETLKTTRDETSETFAVLAKRTAAAEEAAATNTRRVGVVEDVARGMERRQKRTERLVEDVRRAARSLRQAALATALPLTLLTRPSRLFVLICRPPRSHPPPRSLPLSSTWRRLR